jgi:hypothetical protein
LRSLSPQSHHLTLARLYAGFAIYLRIILWCELRLLRVQYIDYTREHLLVLVIVVIRRFHIRFLVALACYLCTHLLRYFLLQYI